MLTLPNFSFFFFFNDTATTEIYTLSLHDALPISGYPQPISYDFHQERRHYRYHHWDRQCRLSDRKSTRLNSSHQIISYAVFCLKKKKKKHIYQCMKCKEDSDLDTQRNKNTAHKIY